MKIVIPIFVSSQSYVHSLHHWGRPENLHDNVFYNVQNSFHRHEFEKIRKSVDIVPRIYSITLRMWKSTI